MNEPLAKKDSIDLLWTGGWDSTFQLLQLLLVHRSPVIPYYLIDAERQSTGVECLTMKNIKNRLFKEFPHTRELLQPTRYFAVSDITPDPVITTAFESVVREKFMGSQYDWLPRFCKQNGVTDIQLCIHLDDKAHSVIDQVVSQSTHGSQATFRVDSEFQETNEYQIFRYFSYPIFNLTKLEMSATADRNGWKSLMDMTWFCHKPTRRMKPCGICNPCLYTIEEGLGSRIPLGNRLLGYFYAIARRQVTKIRARRAA